MFKPFEGLADVIAEREAERQAVIDAEKRKRAFWIQSIKIRNRRFREDNFTHFLENIIIEYSRKHDYLRIIDRRSMMIREYPKFLEKDYPVKYIYGGINEAWMNITSSDIPIQKKFFRRALLFGSVVA